MHFTSLEHLGLPGVLAKCSCKCKLLFISIRELAQDGLAITIRVHPYNLFVLVLELCPFFVLSLCFLCPKNGQKGQRKDKERQNSKKQCKWMELAL